MGRLYSSAYTHNIGAQRELWNIQPAANVAVKLHSFTQHAVDGSSFTGEPFGEMIEFAIFPYTGAEAANLTTATPNPLNPGYGAADTVLKFNLSGDDSGSPGVRILHAALNWQGGYIYRPPPLERITLSPSSKWFIRREVQLAAHEWSYTITFEEIGG